MRMQYWHCHGLLDHTKEWEEKQIEGCGSVPLLSAPGLNEQRVKNGQEHVGVRLQKTRVGAIL